MTKATFIFISFLLLTLTLISGGYDASLSGQLIITTPFLLILGIPHGAIDNVLFLRNKKIKHVHFIVGYLLFVSLNVVLWTAAPLIAYLIFLVISAFHFGQSQFCHYFNKQTFVAKLLFFFWGSTLLSGLLYLNYNETQIIMDLYKEFDQFRVLHRKIGLLYFFSVSVSLTIIFTVILTYKRLLTIENMFMEFLVLTLILSAFYLLPLLIGFTLYFIILHAFKVMREEYHFLKIEQQIVSLRGFISLVAPFTVISIVGILILFGCIYSNLVNLSYGYSLLIAFSSITLPHAYVMNGFYLLTYNKQYSANMK